MTRSIYAAVAPDTSGVWAIGDTIEEARAFARERRLLAREDAQALDLDFPDATTDAEWADCLLYVTLTGTTEALRAVVANLGDVIPWCPDDLWDHKEEIAP